MMSDFAAFILTHGRPDRVHTYINLRTAGYTGRIYLVIDDEDKTGDEYRKKYGDEVLTFSKTEIAKTFDEGDNFNDRRTIVYARNACYELAKSVGIKHFIQLDDDYIAFGLRHNSKSEYGWVPGNLDAILDVMMEFYLATGCTSIAMSQGGDHMGGGGGGGNSPNIPTLRRKCMNSFLCTTDKPIGFFGRVNEDVNTYTTLGRRGSLFFTANQAQLNQKQTQSNAGGMTEMYLDSGTYVKSFYSVMYSPSCVKVGEMGDPRVPQNYRLHHAINWNATAPKIIREEYRKTKRSTEVN
jgi:hypothetical protein